MSSPLRVVAILLALLGSAVAHAIPAPADVAPLEPSDRHGKVSRLVTTLFERSHYNRAPIDDAVSARIFAAYLESIDGGRQYFLASDIEEFEPLRNRLDDAVKRGQLQPVFDIYERYVERARDRMEFAIAQLDTEPDFTVDEARLRIIAGEAYGHRSPVEVLSPTLYVDLRLPAGGALDLPPEFEERAVYVAEGCLSLDGAPLESGQMAVLAPGRTVRAAASQNTRAMLLGGAPADGPRHIWWNLVSSSPGRIDRAKADWAAGRFPKVPGETEFIPLPEH
jgi:hypothetical protein